MGPMAKYVERCVLEEHDTEEKGEPTRKDQNGPVGRHVDNLLTKRRVEIYNKRIVLCSKM